MTELLYMTSTNTTAAADSVIPLLTISRRSGCAVQSAGSTIVLNKRGYYKVDASVTFTTPTAGTVTVALQKSGVNVPGLTASVTTADATGIQTVNITGIVRVLCGEGVPVVSLFNDGVAINASNVSVAVEYLN